MDKEEFIDMLDNLQTTKTGVHDALQVTKDKDVLIDIIWDIFVYFKRNPQKNTTKTLYDILQKKEDIIIMNFSKTEIQKILFVIQTILKFDIDYEASQREKEIAKEYKKLYKQYKMIYTELIKYRNTAFRLNEELNQYKDTKITEIVN